MPYESYGTYQTRQALARQRREREEWEAQQKEEQEERVRANTAARETYLAGLAKQKGEADRRHQAEIDKALAPARARARREFQIAHPDRDVAEFEAQVWPLLRANLIEDERARAIEATKEKLRRDPMYSF